MSVMERRRLTLFSQVGVGGISVAEAGRRLGISERQARRLWKRYQEEGDGGLVHRHRGRAGNRRIDPSVRQQALRLYGERYSDFGCTLACEYLLERDGLRVKRETLRRWLIEEGLWHRRHGSPVRRRRRQPRARFGALVQIDGSHHDWFESRLGLLADGTVQRAAPCVLMVMVDDATRHTLARFFPAETTEAAMTIFREWALRFGLPGELYPDRDSIYRINTKSADEIECRTGKRPTTQFGRAMVELGVKLTCAHSPQAKGRVERMNGTLQDRLVKALRLAANGPISDIDTANAFLAETFLPRLNAKFNVAAAEGDDAHLPVAAEALDEALCIRADRTVGRDHCVSWGGGVLQLKPVRGLNLAGKRVTVRQGLDGQVQVRREEQLIEHEPLARRPEVGTVKPTLAERLSHHQRTHKPPADHAWRGSARPRAGDWTPPQPPPLRRSRGDGCSAPAQVMAAP